MSDIAREKYKNLIFKVFNNYLYFHILNYAQVACPNKYTFDQFRQQVLNYGNNAMRFLQNQCDTLDIEELEPMLEEIFIVEEKKNSRED